MGLIKITDDLYINNDLPGWARGKNQPKWHKSLYDRWRHMWSRCRNPEHPRYLKYKDCPIDERYIKLSNYVNDVQLLEDFDKLKENPSKYDIDKDKIDPNNRCYFFEHLSIVTKSENSLESVIRNGTLTSPKPIIGININDNTIIILKSAFESKKLGFDQSCISDCCRNNYCKENNLYKNYRWYFLDMNDRS